MAIKEAFLLVCLLITARFVSAQSVKVLQESQDCSIRGLSVVDDNVAWVSGSKGHVAITTNGGKTWKWQQVKGFEQSDFRDVEAFSAKEAIMMSSGTPALILKTTDGGANWKVVYRNNDKTYFLDAMAFFNSKHGVIMGDPVNGKFLLLETKNKGETWTVLKNAPEALPNEAAFAASGTCLNLTGKNSIEVVTGGAVSRLIIGNNLRRWNATTLPIAQGEASKGAFSIANGGGYSVITGGNYQENKKTDSVVCYKLLTDKQGKFQISEVSPAGYQSGVTYINKATFLATGTSGTNITFDGGKNWKQIDTVSYNVCQKARNGNRIILAGDKGKIASFKNY